MASMFSRRWFLALSGAALAARHNLWAEDTVPSNLDHILLGSAISNTLLCAASKEETG